MNLVYEGNWHTYEEWGGVRIYEDVEGCFHIQRGGYSVYSPPNEPEWEEPYVVSFEDVIELINEWDEIEKENEQYWERAGI